MFLPFFFIIWDSVLIRLRQMTAIIIEDEPLAVMELRNALKEVAPQLEIVATIDSVAEGVEWLREHKADLIFSDVHLGDGRSFEIFRQVEVKVPVIFITAYDEYALQAFKNQGVDYILKPFDREDIRKALEKIAAFSGQGANHQREDEMQTDSPGKYQERFLVQIGAKIKSVPVSEIAYFMADGKYLLLFTHDGANYLVEQTIGGLEDRLDPARFFQINRKFVVSFQAIKEMIRYSNSRIKIILSPLPPENIESIVSAERIREFKEWLNR